MRTSTVSTAPVSNFFEENHKKVWWNGKKCVPLHPLKKNDAPVAQLVEHLTLNQGVQGSSPCGCTKEASDPPFFLNILMHP